MVIIVDEMTFYSPRIHLIGILFASFLILSVFFLVRAKRIQEKYSILWFTLSTFILVISMFNGFLEWFAKIIGVYYAPSAFFSILIAFAYLFLLNTIISISTAKRQNKSLIQEMGLLKQKGRDARKENFRE